MSLKMTVPLEVGIAVRDLPRMRQFYEEELGLSFVSEVAVPAEKSAQAFMSAAGYTVARLQTSYGERIKLIAPVTPPSTQTPTAFILDKTNATYLTFIVDDLQAAVDRLVSAGVDFMTGPTRVEVRPGTWLAFFRDPEGNVIELVQYADIRSYRPDLD